MRIDGYLHLFVPIIISCLCKGLTYAHTSIADNAIYMVGLVLDIVEKTIDI